MGDVMHMFKSKGIDFNYVEVDGDVAFNLEEDGWHLRMTGTEEQIFESYDDLIEEIYKQFPSLDGILLRK